MEKKRLPRGAVNIFPWARKFWWSFGHLSFGQNRKPTVKIRHYNINILFIYSEQ